MKQIIYITKNKIWFENVPSEWSGDGLVEIFKENKQKFGSGEIRIVLGNDVSFVTAFPKEKLTSQTREAVWEETKNYMPFEVERECFDWRVVVVDKKPWIQCFAVEKEFLESVSRAVVGSGISVNLMIPIGIILGQRSGAEKEPVILKWLGLEKISALTINGLTDSVYADIPDAQLINYAKSKWLLEKDPKIIAFDEKSLNLKSEVFKEKNRGADEEILNIPILRNPEQKEERVMDKGLLDNGADSQILPAEDKKPLVDRGNLIIVGLVLMILFVLGIGGWVLFGPKKPVAVPENKVVLTPQPTPTITPVMVDLAKYSVQVLNGSGESGLAAKIKNSLIEDGFEAVDVGNAPDIVGGVLSAKEDVPAEVVDKIKESVAVYVFGDQESLTKDDKYDLVIVVGSKKK